MANELAEQRRLLLCSNYSDAKEFLVVDLAKKHSF